jgi:predicted NBD/HSP70 family sugar kinase
VVIDDSMRPWLGIRRPAEKLKALLGLPVDVDFWTENDANLGGVMELEHGIGRQHSDFLYVHWSTGIGGALVTGGRMQAGGARLAGEIGHTPIPPTEAERDFPVPPPPPCLRCGSNHCLEVLAGGGAIARNFAHGSTGGSLRHMISRAQGEGSEAERAKEELQRAARLLGRALGPIITYNNPSAIILGGQFGKPRPDTSEPSQPPVVGNPYDLIEAAFRRSLQEHTSTRALDAVVEMNSSPWLYGSVQGAVAYGTRKALESYVADRAGQPGQPGASTSSA